MDRDMTAPRSPKRILTVLVRGGISVLALVVLLHFVGHGDFLAHLTSLQPGFLALSLAAFAVVITFSGLRWRALLAGNLVSCSPRDSICLQWIGLFFTLFLPGSVGGDAVRSVYVAQRHRKLAAVVVATVQDRLAGMAALLLIGSVASVATRAQLGPTLSRSLLLLQAVAFLLCLTAFAYSPLIMIARRVGRRVAFGRAVEDFVVGRVPARLRRLGAPLLEPVRFRQFEWGSFVVALVVTTVAGIATYWALGLALGLTISWLGLCVAVPTVTFVRALPISLSGIGVGEGAFIAMLQPFRVARGDALLLSLTGSAVHAIGALVGGLVLLWFMNVRARTPEPGTTS